MNDYILSNLIPISSTKHFFLRDKIKQKLETLHVAIQSLRKWGIFIPKGDNFTVE